MTGLIFLIAVLSALLVLWLAFPRRVKAGVLNDMYTLESAKNMQALDPASLEYQLLAAGLTMKPVTFQVMTYGAALAAFALGAALLGWLVGVVLAGIAWYAPLHALVSKI